MGNEETHSLLRKIAHMGEIAQFSTRADLFVTGSDSREYLA